MAGQREGDLGVTYQYLRGGTICLPGLLLLLPPIRLLTVLSTALVLCARCGPAACCVVCWVAGGSHSWPTRCTAGRPSTCRPSTSSSFPFHTSSRRLTSCVVILTTLPCPVLPSPLALHVVQVVCDGAACGWGREHRGTGTRHTIDESRPTAAAGAKTSPEYCGVRKVGIQS